MSWRARALTVVLAPAKIEAPEWLLPCRATAGNSGITVEPTLPLVLRERFIWFILAKLLLRCSCAGTVPLWPRTPLVAEESRAGAAPLGLQAQPVPRSGPCPEPQDPNGATRGPWLSHRWTRCPIAALPGLPWRLLGPASRSSARPESQAGHAECKKLRYRGPRGITLATEGGKLYVAFHA